VIGSAKTTYASRPITSGGTRENVAKLLGNLIPLSDAGSMISTKDDPRPAPDVVRLAQAREARRDMVVMIMRRTEVCEDSVKDIGVRGEAEPRQDVGLRDGDGRR